jgi:hypothetical protein
MAYDVTNCCDGDDEAALILKRKWRYFKILNDGYYLNYILA